MNLLSHAKRYAPLVCAALAGTLFLAACRVPPTPPPREDGASLAPDYMIFEWRDEKAFRRIPEYFTGREFTGFSRVVRSSPDVREGAYLILGLDFLNKIPAGSRAELRYVRPDKNGEQIQIFDLPDFTGTPVGELYLGLTGKSWPKNLKGKRPTAWALTIRAPDGSLLVSRRSFLWRMPENDAQKNADPAEKSREDEK